MPRAADSQAVLAVVTWMKVYQLLPCGDDRVPDGGHDYAEQAQTIRAAGVS